DTNPSTSIPLLNGQIIRYQRLDGRRIIGPVQEREELPGLEIHRKPHITIRNTSAHRWLLERADSYVLSSSLGCKVRTQLLVFVNVVDIFFGYVLITGKALAVLAAFVSLL